MKSKDSTILILGGGALAAYFLLRKPSKPAISTQPPTNGGELPLPQNGQQPSGEPASEDEKKYIDFYHTAGLYKLNELDTKVFGIPADYSKKGTKSDADWLTDISYWAMYSAPGNEHNTNAPWIPPPDPNNAWTKIWRRMNNYAKTLFAPSI